MPRFNRQPTIDGNPYLKRTSITKEELIEAIPGSKGLLLNLERKLGCTRSCISKMLEQYPEIKQELQDEMEREKDEVLNNLIEDAKSGDRASRKLFLEAQARDRGYGEKVEISGANGQPLVFLHAADVHLTGGEENRNANKENRVEAWSKNAIDFHEKQSEEIKQLSTDEIITKIGGKK